MWNYDTFALRVIFTTESDTAFAIKKQNVLWENLPKSKPRNVRAAMQAGTREGSSICAPLLKTAIRCLIQTLTTKNT